MLGEDDARKEVITMSHRIERAGPDTVPPGTFHGGDTVPAGTFHGGDTVPPGTFH